MVSSSRNDHLKIQELCDCYASNDPLKEMSKIEENDDGDEAALKWYALAVLHGVNNHAEKITVKRSSTGEVEVTARYRESSLPTPGKRVGEKILTVAREISHINEGSGGIPLAMGIRQDSLELGLSVSSSENGESVTLAFP